MVLKKRCNMPHQYGIWKSDDEKIEEDMQRWRMLEAGIYFSYFKDDLEISKNEYDELIWNIINEQGHKNKNK